MLYHIKLYITNPHTYMFMAVYKLTHLQ